MARVQCAMVAVCFITLLLCERKSCTIQQQQMFFTTFAHRRLVCPQTCGRSLKVKDAMHCAFQCLKDTTCRSYNFGVSGDNTGLHDCEVLWTDGVNSSNSLLLDGRYHHYSIQVTLHCTFLFVLCVAALTLLHPSSLPTAMI